MKLDAYATSGVSPPTLKTCSKDTWRQKRDFSYQKKILAEIEQHFASGERIVVLAASCGAGKTRMAALAEDSYLSKNPSARGLNLAHARKDLRSQMFDSFTKLKQQRRISFTFDEIETGADIQRSAAQVIIGIPQTVHKNGLPPFEYLVVDEAHEYYDAKMVQRVISKTAPKRVLLLTGTPMNFVGGRYPIVYMPMFELWQYGVISSFSVELATTDLAISEDDFNVDDNLKIGYRVTPQAVQSAMRSVMAALRQRLERRRLNVRFPAATEPLLDKKGRPRFWKGLPLYAVEAVKFLTEGDKVIISCHSIKQAKEVEGYFAAIGVTAAVSHSKNDLESVEIVRFKTDPDLKILVVVDRGSIGFDYDELTVVVDLTYSRNLHLIHQRFARLVRPHPDKRVKKLFIKACPEDSTYVEYYQWILEGSLLLGHRDWMTTYTGDNARHLPLPVLTKKPSKQKRAKGKGKRKAPTSPPRFSINFPSFQHFMVDVANWLTMPPAFRAKKTTTLAKVRATLFNVQFHDPVGRKKALREYVIANKDVPPSGHPLRTVMARYTSPSQVDTYDAELDAFISPFKKGNSLGVRAKIRDDIWMWTVTHSRPPSKVSKDPEERRLGWAWNRLRGKQAYDAEFVKKMEPYRRSTSANLSYPTGAAWRERHGK